MAGARINIGSGIVRIDAAADLQSSRVGREGRRGLLPVLLKPGRGRGVEEDHMAPLQPVFLEQPGVVRRALLRHEVLLRLVPVILQAPAHELFYFSVVYVDTWPEFHALPPASDLLRYETATPSGPRYIWITSDMS